MNSTPCTLQGASCALRKDTSRSSSSSLGSGLIRQHSQRSLPGSHQKPVFKPPSREMIPALSSLPPFRERHAQLRSKLWKSLSTTDLSVAGRKTAVDRHAACKAPRSASEEASGRPAWDDTTQVTYARPGFEFLFGGPRGSTKKRKAGKKKKVKKGLAEGGVKRKEESVATPKPRCRIRRFSSVPDLSLLSPEHSQEVPSDESSEARETNGKESIVERFLRRMRNRQLQAQAVSFGNQRLKELCKSLEILPLPNEDAPQQIAASRHKEDQEEGNKSRPESRCSAKERFLKAVKKTGPGKPRKLEVVRYPTQAHLKWDEPAHDGGRPVLRYIVEQKRVHGTHWVEALKTPGPECEATVTGLVETCAVLFRVRAVNKASVGEPSDPVDSRATVQSARQSAVTVRDKRKGPTHAFESPFTVPKFSPRPNKQAKETENKDPVERSILSSLSNLKKPHGKTTKLGGSKLRRATSKQDVTAAESKPKTKARSTGKQAARAAAAATSTDKENGQEGATYRLRSASTCD